MMNRLHYDSVRPRAEGYYWVRRLGNNFAQLANWSGGKWYIIGGRSAPLTDNDIAAVSERIETEQEQAQEEQREEAA